MNAQLIKENGEIINVAPQNGTDFSLEELQGYVKGWIEIVRTHDGRIMVINEEGKLRSDMGVNIKASSLYRYGDSDLIMGPAVVCPSEMVK